jgi:GR25 family glycosyltransferase involved in LPS biosynthesis
MNTIDDIKNIVYINLNKRKDRNLQLLEEFKKLYWIKNPHRFSAVETKNGAIGCTISHIRCIELAKTMNWDHVMICEDDIKFNNPYVFTENMNNFLGSGVDWDVILLAGNNVGRYRSSKKVDKIEDVIAVQIQACQTTTGYLVKSHYYDTLLNNFKEGLEKLIREPSKHIYYAIDKYWFSLQNKDNWYLIYPLTVTQQSTHSDIENRETNYDNLMLTLDKSSWVFTKK